MPGLANPIGIDWPWLGAVATVAWITLSFMVLASAICLVLRWHGASGDLRAGLRWVSITGVAMALETFTESTPPGDAPRPGSLRTT